MKTQLGLDVATLERYRDRKTFSLTDEGNVNEIFERHGVDPMKIGIAEALDLLRAKGE